MYEWLCTSKFLLLASSGIGIVVSSRTSLESCRMDCAVSRKGSIASEQEACVCVCVCVCVGCQEAYILTAGDGHAVTQATEDFEPLMAR